MKLRSRSSRRILEEWVRDHHVSTYRAAYRVVRDEGLAMDVAQRTFQRALERDPGDVADPRKLLCWLATRIGLQELRAAKSRRNRETAFVATTNHGTSGGLGDSGSSEADVSQQMEAREERAAVTRCVADLPDELRIPLELRFAEDMTYASIAQWIECSEPTAHDRVRRALDQLRGRLKRSGFAVAFVRLEDHLASPPSIPTPTGLESSLLKAAVPAAIATKVWAAAVILLASMTALVVLPEPAKPTPPEREVSRGTARSPSQPEPTTGPTEPARRETASSNRASAQVDEAPTPTTPFRAQVMQTGSVDALGSVATVRGRVSGMNADLRGFFEAHAFGAEVSKGQRPLAAGDVSPDGTFALSIPVHTTGVRYVTVRLVYAGTWISTADEIRLEPGDDRTIDLSVETDLGERVGTYSLELDIRDRDGVPVPGARVRVRRAIRTTADLPWRKDEGGGTTDAIGRVRVSGERLGSKLVHVYASPLLYEPTSSHELTIDIGGHHARTLQIDRPEAPSKLGAPADLNRTAETDDDKPYIAGRMEDALTGKPILTVYPEVDLIGVPEDIGAAAYISDFLPNHFRRAPRQTAVFGDPPPASDLFHSQAWSPGRVVAASWSPGRAPAFYGPVDLRATPQIDGAVLRFEPEAIVRGVVLAGGKPLEGAVIMTTGTGPISTQAIADADTHMRKSGGEGFLIFADTRTDEDGRFELTGLPADLPIRIVAVHPKFGPRQSGIVPLEAGKTTDGQILSMGPRRKQ